MARTDQMTGVETGVLKRVKQRGHRFKMRGETRQEREALLDGGPLKEIIPVGFVIPVDSRCVSSESEVNAEEEELRRRLDNPTHIRALWGALYTGGKCVPNPGNVSDGVRAMIVDETRRNAMSMDIQHAARNIVAHANQTGPNRFAGVVLFMSLAKAMWTVAAKADVKEWERPAVRLDEAEIEQRLGFTLGKRGIKPSQVCYPERRGRENFTRKIGPKKEPVVSWVFQVDRPNAPVLTAEFQVTAERYDWTERYVAERLIELGDMLDRTLFTKKTEMESLALPEFDEEDHDGEVEYEPSVGQDDVTEEEFKEEADASA